MQKKNIGRILDSISIARPNAKFVRNSFLLLFSGLPIFAWWLAQWPGVLTNDSLITWSQIKSGNYEQFHTVSYTIFVWIFSLGGTLLSLVSLSQAILLFYTFYRLLLFCNTQMSKEVAAISTSFLYWLPYLGGMGGTLWKDIPFTAITLLGLIRMFSFRLQSTKEKAFSLLILSIGISFRHDGILWAGLFGVLLALAGLIKFVRNKKTENDLSKKVFGIFLSIVFSMILTQGLNLITSAVPSEPFFTKLPLIGDIAYVAQTQPNMTPDSVKKDIQRIASGEAWSATRDCTTLSGLLFYPGFSEDATNEYAKQSLSDLKLLIEAGLWNELIGAHLCRAKSFIPPPFSTGPSYAYWTASGIAQTEYNEFGLQSNPPLQRLSDSIEKWRLNWDRYGHKLAWPGLLFALSLFLLVINASIRPTDRKKYLYLALLMGSRLIGLVLFTLAQDFRYALIVHLVFLALVVTTIFNLLHLNKSMLRIK
jgi:hypothetical protein